MNNNIIRQAVVNFICDHAIVIVLDLGTEVSKAKRKKQRLLTTEELQEICPRYFNELEGYVNTGLTMYEHMLIDNTEEDAKKMSKPANLHECIARYTRDVLQLFPQKARKWNAISVDELDKVEDFANEYFEDVRDILLEMAAERIEIERKFQNTIDNCNK